MEDQLQTENGAHHCAIQQAYKIDANPKTPPIYIYITFLLPLQLLQHRDDEFLILIGQKVTDLSVAAL